MHIQKSEIECNETIAWNIDSGATDHFVYDRNLLTHFHQFQEKQLVTGISYDNRLDIVGIGQVTTDKLILKQVYLFPSMEENLLSISALSEAGIHV